ncbi:unnamed protein product [Orchesella dallaii]|uniref:Uncharacterized protein n=1 Tax=Orchesella dallaii TaxID=48710 RepID=A0ABP1RRJ5_9HEXA
MNSIAVGTIFPVTIADESTHSEVSNDDHPTGNGYFEDIIAKTRKNATEKLKEIENTGQPNALKDRKDGPVSSLILAAAVFAILSCLFILTLLIRVAYLYEQQQEPKLTACLIPLVAFKNEEPDQPTAVVDIDE